MVAQLIESEKKSNFLDLNYFCSHSILLKFILLKIQSI